MRLPLYQVDAFTGDLFRGNPAAVCPLERWLPDATMQAIAAENNLSETAFFVRDGDGYTLRWFTPTVEVDLCGHATLASGFVVMSFLEPEREAVSFRTVKAGTLTVTRNGNVLAMDFPARPTVPAVEDCWAAIATAPGDNGTDFVSRFFAPAQGVPEDPATGSSPCTLTPYWAERLGKRTLEARQLSRRGGARRCPKNAERVTIAGRAVLYLEGEISV